MKLIWTSGGCWPTPRQERLLHAALDGAPEALENWRAFSEETGLDNLDHGEFRLLPLVYWNLLRLGAGNGLLRGIHRRAWCENQLLFRRMASLLEDMHAAGVPLLLLKGAPLARLHYADIGLRPMQDLDVLVPAARLVELVRRLEEQGWRQAAQRRVRLKGSYLRFRHAFCMRHEQLGEFDLHWHVTHYACHDAADAWFWNSAVPIDFEGLPLRTLCPTAHLLHACVHGVEWADIPPMRWAADAMTLMRANEIEWDRLAEVALRLRLMLPVGDALAYLERTFAAPVPAAVLERLRQEPVSRGERCAYQRITDPWSHQSPWDVLLAHYTRHRRNRVDQSPARVLASFPLFLQHYWRKESLLGLVAGAWRWSYSRLQAEPERHGRSGA